MHIKNPFVMFWMTISRLEERIKIYQIKFVKFFNCLSSFRCKMSIVGEWETLLFGGIPNQSKASHPPRHAESYKTVYIALVRRKIDFLPIWSVFNVANHSIPPIQIWQGAMQENFTMNWMSRREQGETLNQNRSKISFNLNPVSALVLIVIMEMTRN